MTRIGRHRRGLAMAALLLALALTMALAVGWGVADVDLAQSWSLIWSHLTGAAAAPGDRTADAIVWNLRLPRVLTAAAVGAGLGVAGAAMQALTRNPLADPYLLGLSSGASLGAVSVLLLGLGSSLAFATVLPAAAFAGAALALAASLVIARLAGSVSPSTAVLAGVAVSQLLAAVTSLVIVVTAKGDAYRQVVSWLLGSLAGSTWTTVAIAFTALAVVLPVILAASRKLDALALGDTAAATLGVDVTRLRIVMFAVVALLTGAMVSTSGAIGFVGLVLPHMVRGLVGALSRHVLPACAVGGALFLVIADTVARTAWDPREVPVGIVTALVGVPLFVLVLRRAREGKGGFAAWS